MKHAWRGDTRACPHSLRRWFNRERSLPFWKRWRFRFGSSPEDQSMGGVRGWPMKGKTNTEPRNISREWNKLKIFMFKLYPFSSSHSAHASNIFCLVNITLWLRSIFWCGSGRALGSWVRKSNFPIGLGLARAERWKVENDDGNFTRAARVWEGIRSFVRQLPNEHARV